MGDESFLFILHGQFQSGQLPGGQVAPVNWLVVEYCMQFGRRSHLLQQVHSESNRNSSAPLNSSQEVFSRSCFQWEAVHWNRKRERKHWGTLGKQLEEIIRCWELDRGMQQVPHEPGKLSKICNLDPILCFLPRLIVSNCKFVANP